MRIAILPFSEAKKEPELALALLRAEMEAVYFSENEVPEKWADSAGYILISGERPVLTAANLAALRIESARGKPILGLGMAAAVLVDNGLVPGLEGNRAAIKLAPYANPSTETRIRLLPDYQYNAFTRYL